MNDRRKSTPEIGSWEVERPHIDTELDFDPPPARSRSGRNLERAKNPCRARGEGGGGGSRRLRPWKEVVAIHGRKEAQILGLALPGTRDRGPTLGTRESVPTTRLLPFSFPSLPHLLHLVLLPPEVGTRFPP